MSLCRDMMPPWEMKAEMDRLTARVAELEGALQTLFAYTSDVEHLVYDAEEWVKEHAAVSAARAALTKESADG